MGILRFILCIAVVMTHSNGVWGYHFLSGMIAVKIFFIISGFYMAFILEKKYHVETGGYWLFISNRLLRLMPCYYLTLLLALFLQAGASLYFHHPFDRLALWLAVWRDHNLGGFVSILVSHLTMIGLDWLTVLNYSPGGFAWPSQSGGHPLVEPWRFLLLPQSWSLSVELGFYLMVPFLNRLSSRWLFGCLTGSLLVLLGSEVCWSDLIYRGIFYYTFPFQSAYFLMGMLVCRHRKEIVRLFLPWQGLLLGFTVGLAIFYEVIGWVNNTAWGFWLLMIMISFSLPLIFELTRKLNWDRALGSLSYPIYLVHEPVKWVLIGIGGETIAGRLGNTYFFTLFLLSTVVSIGFYRFIDSPIDLWRQGRLWRHEAQEGTRKDVDTLQLPRH